MQTFIEKMNSGRAFCPAIPHPDFRTFAYRMELPPGESKGRLDIYVPDDEFVITVRNVDSRHGDYHDDQPGLGRLVFVFHLSGAREIALDHGIRKRLEAPTLAILYHPEGVTKRNIWHRGDSEYSIVIGVWAATPPDILRSNLTLLPNWSGCEEQPDRSLWCETPLSFELAQAAQQLATPRIHARLLQDYLRIKAKELLCLGLDAMLTQDDVPDTDEILKRRVSYAKSLIESSLKCPPTLAELSRQTSVTHSVLSRALRDANGSSMGQYIVARRMANAKRLVATTDQPLKQIAYDLGYNHTSNFCIAFKRHFGLTPGEARDRARRLQAH